MIIVKKYALLLIFVSQFSQYAHADTYYYGVGFKSCEMWLRDLYAVKSDYYNNAKSSYDVRSKYAVNIAWVNGFISAHGWKKDWDNDAELDYEAFVTKYCKENPLDNIHDAAQALVK